MKKTFSFIAGAISVLLVYFMLTGYGNLLIHRGLNGLMINQFESKFVTSLSPLLRFKNYQIYLKSNMEFEGEAIVARGYFDVDYAKRKYSAGKWIQEGGFSADEPEIFASFRHFYDPTAPEGERYLQNHLDYVGEIGLAEQPKIDHINWALDHPMHEYNWKNGKTAMISALNTSDKDFRNNELAFAFRALGETLHMIADMGLPAHVRDDSHASKSIAGYNLGSPDAYEEYSELFNLVDYDLSKVDPILKTKFSEAKTVKEIAHTLAVYTNENFFTGQTIYGNDKDGELVSPLIHADDPYDLPDLDDCKYDILSYVYTKQISGQTVLMCKDHYYSRFYKGYPYIDKECAESQANVLIPQIVDAGANVIKLFIPELEVVITDYNEEEKYISGTVKHKTDNEYDREIKYNGLVEIYDVKSQKIITEVECIDGVFNDEIRKRDFRNVDWQKGIYAQINLRAILIQSDPFLQVKRGEVTGIDIEIYLDKASYQTKHDEGQIETTIGWRFYFSEMPGKGEYTNSGNSVTYRFQEEEEYAEYTGSSWMINNKSSIEMLITFNDGSNSLNFSAYNNFKSTLLNEEGSEIEHLTDESASFSDLPRISSSSSTDIYEITGKEVENIVASVHHIEHELYDYDARLLNTNCGNEAKITVKVSYYKNEE